MTPPSLLSPLAAPILAPILAPLLALALALPAPSLAEPAPPAAAEEASQDAARARSLALGLAALAAVALAVRAADREDDREEERDDDREEAAARRLPAACLRPYEVARGSESPFGTPPGGRSGARSATLHDPGCLDARVERAAELPLACAVTLRTRRGFETGFDPACLAEAGWHTD